MKNQLTHLLAAIVILGSCNSEDPLPAPDTTESDNEPVAYLLSKENPVLSDMSAHLATEISGGRASGDVNQDKINWERVTSIASEDSSTVVIAAELFEQQGKPFIKNLVAVYHQGNLTRMYLQELIPSYEYLSQVINDHPEGMTKGEFLSGFIGYLRTYSLDGTLLTESLVNGPGESGRSISDATMLSTVTIWAERPESLPFLNCRGCWSAHGYAYEDSNNSYSSDTSGNGGGGSGTSSGSNTPVSNDGDEIIGEDGLAVAMWELTRINDQMLLPCMQAIVADLKNLTKGVGETIQVLAGETPGFNWQLLDGDLASATAITSTQYNSISGTVTTTFDSQSWKNATELSWARTLLHEAMHAYMVAYYSTNRPAFLGTYPEMVEDWDTFQNWNEVHHEEFARSLVNRVADALQEYGVTRGYDHNRQFYEDMSWGGLQSTTLFQSFSSTDQERILNTIAIELTSKDLNGTTQLQKGDDADC